MRYQKSWPALFVLLCQTLSAAPTGGIEARAEQGRLTFVSSWWKPSPDWQARWWWRDGIGSAWIRAGGLQVGPLIVTSGGDGWRRWYPGTTLSTGYWGAGFDGGPWGVWAVQRPDTFEGGAQLGASDGTVSVAIGADRTWSLEPPKPGDIPWIDRARSGLTWDDGAWLAGTEATGLLDAVGGRGWQVKGHAAFDGGPWYAGARAEDVQDIGTESQWEVSGVTGWEAWSVRWTQAQDHDPVWEARWADDARWQGVTWGAEVETARKTTGWTVKGGVSASGRWDEARWSATWSAAPADTGVQQTVTGAWRQGGLEAEARWKIQGQSLGWFGPSSEFALTVRKLF